MAKSRNEIRQSIFAAEKRVPKSIAVSFFGEDVEVRQPDLNTILQWNSASEDRREAMLNMLLSYTFVPGTDEKVFEDEDREILLQMPFGSDFTALQKAIGELTDLQVLAKSAEKNSDGTVNDSNS